MTSRQFVIMSKQESTSNGMVPLGSRQEIIEELGHCNVAPEDAEHDALHGPGIRLDLPPDQDPVSQILMTIVEEEIAWPVVVRLARRFDWKVLDMETGRELNA